MESKMSKLLGDPFFTQKLFETEEPEQVQLLFQENGEEISLEEIKALGRAVNTTVVPSGELNDDELEEVAGGVQISNPGAGWASAKQIAQIAARLSRRGIVVSVLKW